MTQYKLDFGTQRPSLRNQHILPCMPCSLSCLLIQEKRHCFTVIDLNLAEEKKRAHCGMILLSLFHDWLRSRDYNLLLCWITQPVKRRNIVEIKTQRSELTTNTKKHHNINMVPITQYSTICPEASLCFRKILENFTIPADVKNIKQGCRKKKSILNF